MRGEWAEKGHGVVVNAFEKRLGGAGQRGKRGGRRGASAWRQEKEERGAGVVVGSSGRPAMAPDHRARVARLPHEQGRVAGVDDTGDGVSATDGRDRGEARPGGSGRGAR
jgi:hypothetical protein